MKFPRWNIRRPTVFGQRNRTYCPKLREVLDLPSLLEFERQRQLSYDPHVRRYYAQRTVAEAFVEGRLRHSIFDFDVERVDGSVRYEEVKYSSELRDPRSRAHTQIRVQRQWCEAMEKEHLLVTEHLIWANPTLNNSLAALMAEFTVKYPRLLDQTSHLREPIFEYVLLNPGTTIANLTDGRPKSASLHLYRFVIFELIRRQHLDADIENVSLGNRSRLRVRRIVQEEW